MLARIDGARRYNYDVYGAPTFMNASSTVISATAYGNRFLFTGRERFSQLALNDYRNRMYSPQLGRFLQTDPIRFDAEDVNIYRYVGNNSINYTDFDGQHAGPGGNGNSGSGGGGLPGWVGSAAAGALGGAMAGALLGCMEGPVGTGIGAAAGAVRGAIAGGIGGAVSGSNGTK